MTSIVSTADAAKLARPHVARCWFVNLDLPSGMSYLHSGTGRITIDGNEYRGVSDPVGGRLVSISQVDEPQFGQAAAVTITLTGADKAFVVSVHATGRQIEGRAAEIYWAAFDGETQEILTVLIPVFPSGRMTAPSIMWQGIGLRSVVLTIEGIWQAKNFAPNGRWNNADQQRRFPGDKGLKYIGVKISEDWK